MKAHIKGRILGFTGLAIAVGYVYLQNNADNTKDYLVHPNAWQMGCFIFGIWLIFNANPKNDE